MQMKDSEIYKTLLVWEWLENNKVLATRRFKLLLRQEFESDEKFKPVFDVFKKLLKKIEVGFEYEYCEASEPECIKGYAKIGDKESPRIYLFEVKQDSTKSFPSREDIRIEETEPKEGSVKNVINFILENSFSLL